MYLLWLHYSDRNLEALSSMKLQEQNGQGRGRTRGKRYVYGFGGGKADGEASLNWLLGGKGANLAEMASLGLPVPPGMTITTEVCSYYYTHAHHYPPELTQQVQAGLKKIEKIMGQ